jgi:hypothetical protein
MSYYYEMMGNSGINHPIAAGKSRSILIPTPFSSCDGGIQAILFADGYQSGDLHSVNDLVKRQSAIINEYKDLEPFVKQLAMGKLDKLGFLNQLNQHKKQVLENQLFSATEKNARGHAIQSLLFAIDRPQIMSVGNGYMATGEPDSSAVPTKIDGLKLLSWIRRAQLKSNQGQAFQSSSPN